VAFVTNNYLSSLLAYDEQHVSKKDEGVGDVEKKGYTFVKRKRKESSDETSISKID
jgi:hypothetical protein